MTVRNIKKNLAGAEDLLHGIGLESQVRGGAVYDMHKLDTYVPTYDVAEMQKSSLTFMRLYGDDTHYTDYRRNPAGTVGIPSDLGGVWEPIKTSELQVVGNSLYGAYVYGVDQVMCHTGTRYSWSGAFPKVVSAGSTPATSGGVGVGAWVDRTQGTLRDELQSSDGSSKIVESFFGGTVADFIKGKTGKFSSLDYLLTITNLEVGMRVKTLGYYSGTGVGGNEYEVVAAGTATADGGSYINHAASGVQLKGLFPYAPNAYQFGAKSGDVTFDSASALQALSTYVGSGGKIEINGEFYVSPLTFTRQQEFSGSGSLNAFAAQTHVVKIAGTNSSNKVSHVKWNNSIKIYGNSKIISDAAFVVEHATTLTMWKPHIEYVYGWAMRLKDCMEMRMYAPFVRKVGGLGKGGILIDDYDTTDQMNVNNLQIIGGTFGAVNGPHIRSTSLSNLDLCWIAYNKFEWDSGWTENSNHASDQAVILLDGCARVDIHDNGFANYAANNTSLNNGFAYLVQFGGASKYDLNVRNNMAVGCVVTYGVYAVGGSVTVTDDNKASVSSGSLANYYPSTSRCSGPRAWKQHTSNNGYLTYEQGGLAPLTYGATALTQTTKNNFVYDSGAKTQTQQVLNTTYSSADIIIGDLYQLNEIQSLPLADSTTVTIGVHLKEVVDGVVLRLSELSVNLTPATTGSWIWMTTTTTLGTLRGLSRIRLLHQSGGQLFFDCIGFSV